MGTYLVMGLLVEAREPEGKRQGEGRQSKEGLERVLGEYVSLELYELDETSGYKVWRLREGFLGQELVDYLRWQLDLWMSKGKESEEVWEGLLASASWEAVRKSLEEGDTWNLRFQGAEAHDARYTLGLPPLDAEILVFATDGKISAEGLGFVYYLRSLLKTQASRYPLVGATVTWMDG